MKPDVSKSLKRNIFLRLFGKCATKEPESPGCWSFADGKLVIDLSKTPELTDRGNAVRIENESLPCRVLIVYGDDGEYRAYLNRCTHGGRRLDPVPGAGTVQCCSVGKSVFDYEGKLLAGSAKDDITTYPVELDGNRLTITIF